VVQPAAVSAAGFCFSERLVGEDLAREGARDVKISELRFTAGN